MSSINVGKNLMIRKSETIVNVFCECCGREILACENNEEDCCCLKVYACKYLDCFMSTKFAKENKYKIYKELKKEFGKE